MTDKQFRRLVNICTCVFMLGFVALFVAVGYYFTAFVVGFFYILVIEFNLRQTDKDKGE